MAETDPEVDESPSGTDADEICSIAYDTAMRKAYERCMDDEAAEKHTAPFVGISADEAEQVDCSQVLMSPPGPDSSLSAVKQWVHCRVHHSPPGGGPSLLDQHDGNYADAVAEAWNQAENAVGASFDAAEPEPEPQPDEPEPETAEPTVEPEPQPDAE